MKLKNLLLVLLVSLANVFAQDGLFVTVLPFTTQKSDNSWNGIGSGISELISARLSECKVLLLQREKISPFIKQSTGDTTVLLDKEKVFSAGLSFNVATIIKGDFSLNRQSVFISAKIIDTRNGLIVQTISKETNLSGDALSALADSIAMSYLQYASIVCQITNNNTIGTASLSALQEFGTGLDFHMNFSGSQDEAKAVFHYNRSLSIDSAFGLPAFYRDLLNPAIIANEKLRLDSANKATQPAIDSNSSSQSQKPDTLPSLPLLQTQIEHVQTETSDSTSKDGKLPFSKLDFEAAYTSIEYAQGYEVHKGFYENGKIRQICLYKNGKLNNLSRLYFPNGKIRAEIRYTDNFPNGTCRTFFDNGKTEEEVAVSHGKRNGTTTTFYQSGLRKETIEYTYGVKSGNAKMYYPKGSLLADYTYANDVVIGEYREYYENGSFKRRVAYKKGSPKGLERSYFPDGKIMEEVKHSRFSLTAPVKGFYPSGKVRYTGRQMNGKNEGVFKYFKEDASPDKTVIYKDGVVVVPEGGKVSVKMEAMTPSPQ